MKLIHLPNSSLAIATIAVTTAFPTLTSAESLGQMTARSADVSEYSEISVEGGIKFGEIDAFGARATISAGNGFAFFGDFSFLDDEDFKDANAFGAGAIYEIEGLAANVNTAVMASFHMATFDDFDLDVNALGVRGLISGVLDAEANVALTWFASFGFERQAYEAERCTSGFFSTVCRTEEDDDVEPAFGVGIIAAAGPGEAYAGVDYIDDASFAIGYRINL